MTTIVACRREAIMVADSKCTFNELSFRTPKVRATSKFLVGAAGDSSATEIFMRKFPRLPELSPGTAELEFQGLALTPKGIITYDGKFNPLEVDEEYWAIGTGAMAALAVLRAAIREGRTPDPVLAVEIACEIDVNSGPPVTVYELKGR